MINALFLCIGNSCRSPMAEAFARTYGSDVMVPYSAGLSPAPIVQPLTIKVMAEKNIILGEEYYPKDVGELPTQDLQLIVNISGKSLPIREDCELREWKVEDPIGQDEEVYRKVRDQLERLVMDLILDLRRREVRRTTPQTGPRKAIGTAPEPPAPSRVGFGRIRRPRE